jgi:hypothetical protein
MRRSREFGTSHLDKTTKHSQTDSAFLKERARIRAANDEKTARLRALRLAKEATERQAAAAAEAEGVVKKPPRSKKAAQAKATPAVAE